MCFTTPCRVAVEIHFTAHHEKDYNFKLKCKVKRKVTPLVLRVNAEGYSINLGISYISPDGSELKLPVGRADQRRIDFGQVQVNDSALGEISLFNHSLYSFEYRWALSNPSKYAEVVVVEPDRGEVGVGCRANSRLMFKPTKKMTLQNCKLTLEVRMSKMNVRVNL